MPDFDWDFRPTDYSEGPTPLMNRDRVMCDQAERSDEGGRVEIVSISMSGTVHDDEISIWARPLNGRCTYGIASCPYIGMKLGRRSSRMPLTFREVTEMLIDMEGDWIVSRWYDALECELDPFSYVWVSSSIYPQLEAWVDARFAIWQWDRDEDCGLHDEEDDEDDDGDADESACDPSEPGPRGSGENQGGSRA